MSLSNCVNHYLAKFSKAILSNRAEPSQIHAEDLHWQHYTDPVLRVSFTMSTSANELSEARLHVFWTPEGSSTSILEDVNFLAFRSKGQIGQLATSSVKAVYRDCIVGFRYLKSLPSNTGVPEYARFQLTFRTVDAAMQLIDAIRPVCPCKYSNIAPTPHAMVAPAHSSMVPDSVLAGSQVPTSSQQPAFHTPTSKFITPSTATMTSYQGIACLNDRGTEQDSDPFTRPGFSSSQLPSSQLSQRQDYLSSITCTPAPPTRPNIPYSSDARLEPASTPLTPNPEERFQPSSSSHVAYTHPVSFPPQPAEDIPSVSANSASLGQISDLNNLPMDKLEELVANVIREDGFAQLLEKMDNLWKIKGFLAR